MNNSDKTIPYRLSLAELVNIRILQKKAGSIDSNDHGEENLTQEIMDMDSDLVSNTKVTEKNVP